MKNFLIHLSISNYLSDQFHRNFSSPLPKTSHCLILFIIMHKQLFIYGVCADAKDENMWESAPASII